MKSKSGQSKPSAFFHLVMDFYMLSWYDYFVGFCNKLLLYIGILPE